MERGNKAARRPSRTVHRERFSGLVRVRERSPREEAIEILAEGLWTLICQGRGPAAGKFRAVRDEADDLIHGEREPAGGDVLNT
jgi:hypothetical protein